jgi:hypothetical protein
MPIVAANNFKLKQTLSNILSQHMFQLAHEDQNQHLLSMFEKLYNTIKINDVQYETIKLRVFSLPFHSLTSYLQLKNIA